MTRVPWWGNKSQEVVAGEVAADGADLRAVEVAVLDLGDLPLSDADALGQLGLRETFLLAQHAQAVGADLCEPERSSLL